MSEMHAYVLEKAARGEQVAGHKYKSRKRVGNKWVYEYEGAAKRPVTDAAKEARINKYAAALFGEVNTPTEINTRQERADKMKYEADERNAINEWVRNSKHIRYAHEHPFIPLIEQAMQRAEQQQAGYDPATLFRGLVLDNTQLAAIKKDGYFTDNGLSSWTADPKVAASFAAGGFAETKVRVALRVRTKRGLVIPPSIAGFRAYEVETVLPPVKLRVAAVRKVLMPEELVYETVLPSYQGEIRPAMIIELEEVV